MKLLLGETAVVYELENAEEKRQVWLVIFRGEGFRCETRTEVSDKLQWFGKEGMHQYLMVEPDLCFSQELAWDHYFDLNDQEEEITPPPSDN